MEEKIYEIIEKYDGSGQVDECLEEIEKYLQKLNDTGEILGFLTFSDTDVFDSCGLDILYVAVSWVDIERNINMCGARLTSQ